MPQTRILELEQLHDCELYYLLFLYLDSLVLVKISLWKYSVVSSGTTSDSEVQIPQVYISFLPFLKLLIELISFINSHEKWISHVGHLKMIKWVKVFIAHFLASDLNLESGLFPFHFLLRLKKRCRRKYLSLFVDYLQVFYFKYEMRKKISLL